MDQSSIQEDDLPLTVNPLSISTVAQFTEDREWFHTIITNASIRDKL